MANSDVISAVSETLEKRLTAGLSTLGPPPPTARLHDLVTPVTSDPPTVTLFLYQIVEDPSVRNRHQDHARRQRRPEEPQAAAGPLPALHGHRMGR
jgi:hypothetical protein